jgi:NAD(P)-dependent dehydrogenase (short-subunit alcohol dehydrogenase family)
MTSTPRPSAALIAGASRGLGAALAEALALRGVAVVLSARSAADLSAIAAGIRARGGAAHELPADLSEPADVSTLLPRAAALAGNLDLVAVTAGSLGPVPLEPLLDTRDDDLERALAVNLLAPFRLARAAAPGMLARGGGTLLFVTSDAATEAYRGWGAYGLSKAALGQMARILSVELLGTSVRVLTVDPGEMDTRMHHDALPEADRSALARPRDVAERLAEIVMRGRFESGTRVRLEVRPAAPAAKVLS